ncbi:copper resistance system multicopper oxidase [Pseudodesulfovibrio cashew]|uniref:Copper resistance system multicopper oxidase n=1 Tax=Pseudodesulfovibrio cashew TaxID=2678688 RepID=A0A6I6JJN0_9BACT|nr:copper resistance system multicopper oxidase [Pseudodesulfovibrio cashew]QGY40563.1 copper resistance system multicopper oxidase [Pseudodesulfovibrio cashew]
MKNPLYFPSSQLISRRRFVTGLAAGGALLGLGLSPARLLATTGSTTPMPERRGNHFTLDIAPLTVNFTGAMRTATAIGGSVPGPVLRWREGDTVTLDVTNRLAVDSSIHWHGIILPTGMDGVPEISYPGIRPGETFRYRFTVRQSGTFWYHSHSGFQEQTGMYGPIVIEPRDQEPNPCDRDYVVMLSDWTDEEPDSVYAKLKKLSHYYNFNERTVGDLIGEIREKGLARTWNDRAMWNRMRMSDRDLSDVTGYTYTYLMNGRTPSEGWTGLFKPGEKVRLRFINGSAMTFFDVRIPGLKMTVVAADGQDIQPVAVDEFRIGVAETYDVVVEPDDGAYCVFAQAIDRSGYAHGTLTPDISLKAEVPPFDPLPLLSHKDMGMRMNMGDMDGSMSMGDAGSMSMNTMDSGNGAMNAKTKRESAMPGMQPMEGADMNNTVMGAPAKGTMASMPSEGMSGLGKAGYGSNAPVVHVPTEFGPHVAMRTENPQYRLDDPGAGLRNNGRRVLCYADLRNLHPTPDPREPEREIQLHLTGNMSRYMWSINGVKYADAEPLRFRYGERLRITFVNDTMMNHPMHLHGMWSDLETGDPKAIPRKHTVIVQPGSKISYLVTADAMGSWAYHCHLLYHMAGMFRKVVVSEEGK